MIHDVLFPPPKSPVFVLFRVLVSSSSKSMLHPVQSPVSSSSKSSSILSKSSPLLFLRVPFLSLRPLLSSQSPLTSSSNSRARPLHPLSSSSVLSPPPPPRIIEKQRNDTKPSRRSWLWVVPKWNMIPIR